jgi:hypothetical protein
MWHGHPSHIGNPSLLAMTFFSRFQVWPAGGLMTIPQENGSHHPTFDHGTHVLTRIV